MAIVHGIVMHGFGYEKYESSKYLLYSDIESEYPRETFTVKSGENNLSAYLFGKGNEKGLIVIPLGHGDSNDIKLYETRYFVDAGYAAGAVLNMDHNVAAVVSASGFDTPEEQWQCSVKRFTGFAYPIIKPINSLFIELKYGEDKNLSAVEGINSVDIPVWVIE